MLYYLKHLWEWEYDTEVFTNTADLYKRIIEKIPHNFALDCNNYNDWRRSNTNSEINSDCITFEDCFSFDDYYKFVEVTTDDNFKPILRPVKEFDMPDVTMLSCENIYNNSIKLLCEFANKTKVFEKMNETQIQDYIKYNLSFDLAKDLPYIKEVKFSQSVYEAYTIESLVNCEKRLLNNEKSKGKDLSL